MKVLRTAFLLALAVVGACRSPTDEGEPCGTPPYFTALPVAVSDTNAITEIGGFGAPVHTLPTPHAGIYLARAGVTVRSPGAIGVTRLRRTTDMTSPFRQGLSDYTVEYRVCREITGWFGHLTTLSPSFPESELNWRDCETYPTSQDRSAMLLRTGRHPSRRQASLGATVAVVPRLTNGRVNRAFEHLTPDGVLHCYGPPLLSANQSWFVALMPNGQVSIERRPHPIGASPCLGDPSTWSFSASRVTMLR